MDQAPAPAAQLARGVLCQARLCLAAATGVSTWLLRRLLPLALRQGSAVVGFIILVIAAAGCWGIHGASLPWDLGAHVSRQRLSLLVVPHWLQLQWCHLAHRAGHAHLVFSEVLSQAVAQDH